MKCLTCDVLKIKMLNIFRGILETEADLKPKQAQFPPPPKLVAADGWLCQRFLPVKKE